MQSQTPLIIIICVICKEENIRCRFIFWRDIVGLANLTVTYMQIDIHKASQIQILDEIWGGASSDNNNK